LDPSNKRARLDLLKADGEAWTAYPFDSGDVPGITAAIGEVSLRVWPSPGSMGWSHPKGSLKTSLWDKAEGPSGSVLDASIGIRAKGRWSFLFPNEAGRATGIPVDRKNGG